MTERRGRHARGIRRKESILLSPEAVRYWRLQRGLTQEALAGRGVPFDGHPGLRISLRKIREIERDGRCGPSNGRLLAAVLGVDIAQLLPRDLRNLPCGLPRPGSVDFVGRESQLRQVLHLLSSPEGSWRVTLHGPPGVGKTEIALQLVAELERARRYRIFWFDATDADLSSAWANVVAPHLGVEHRLPAERARLAFEVVAKASLEEPVLLVLDNVSEWSASKPWPRIPGSRVAWLVTTQIKDLGHRAFHHVEVEMLAPASAEELLLRIAGRALRTQPGFEDLLAYLDGYSIAVEIAAAFLARFGDEYTPAQYLAALRSGELSSPHREVESRTFYGRTLDAAFRLLWARLPEAVRRAWRLAAQFEDASASAALSTAVGLDGKARARLRDLHVLRPEGSTGWTMHRLARDFARGTADDPEASSARRSFVVGCMSHLLSAEPDAVQRLYLEDRPHLDAALAHAGAFVPPDIELRGLLSVGSALDPSASTRAALFERAVACAQRIGRVEDAVLALANLWKNAQLQGRKRDAEHFAGQLIALTDRHPTKVHRGLALRVIGESAFWDGDLERSRSALGEALEMVEDIGREAIPMFMQSDLSILSHAALANVFAGFPKLALSLAERALALAAARSHPPSILVASLIHGSVHGVRMELAQAHAHFSRALQISTDLDIASFKQFAQMRCMLFERLTGPPVPAAELARNRRLLSVRRNVPGSAEFPLGAGSELALIAGVYLRLGDRSRGMRAVDRGLIPAIVERAPLFAPELWRLKGLCSASASEAKHCLTRALDLALSQGARWLALRAATELCLGADDAATRRAASETLGKLLSEIPSEDGLFDLVRARRALELARRLDSPLE